MSILPFLILFILNVNNVLLQETPAFVTQTVYGFLDFTTTIENTVMIFSPQSAPVLDFKEKIIANAIETKPVKQPAQQPNVANTITPTKLNTATKIASPKKSTSSSQSSSAKQKILDTNNITDTPISTSSSTRSITSNSKTIVEQKEQPFIVNSTIRVENNLYQPEYDLLSRQPAEYAEETYRVINLKSKLPHASDNHRSGNNNPKRISNASHLTAKVRSPEVSVTPTTTSAVGLHKNDRHKIRPSSPLRVLKTNAPVLGSANRKRNRPAETSESNSVVIVESTVMPEQTKKKSSSRHKSKRRNKSRTASNPKKSNIQEAVSSSSTSFERRSFRPKIQPSTVDATSPTSTSLYMFKLNRSPGQRWQYKSPPKPRVTIRKSQTVEGAQNSVAAMGNSTLTSENPLQNTILNDVNDLEASDSSQGSGAISNNINAEGNNRQFIVETLNVEIYTPTNLKNTYYEIATIKSPVTYQAGSVKKTRYVTTTSTFEKVLTPDATTMEPLNDDEPLTQNILATTTKSDNIILDGSITTLNPLYLTNDAETPILETITESFSITQTKLRTQILPVVHDEKKTNFITLVQTLDITSLLTVTKTLSPAEQFIPSLSFKDFRGNLDEAGSEINLELEFGDDGNDENLKDDKAFMVSEKFEEPKLKSTEAPTTPLPPGFSIITTSYPLIRLETIWSSAVVPVVNGISTNYRTLSKSVGTYEKTEYKTDTTTIQIPLQPQVPTQINPFLLPVQHIPTVTSYVFESVATQTNSQVLKLTFGARTAYTTIFSTEVKPTLFTSFVTTSIPVQPTAFPGYYPPPGFSPPYPPYPYLG